MTAPQPAALPEHTIGKHDHPEPHTMCWSDLEIAAIKRYAESYALAALQSKPAAETALQKFVRLNVADEVRSPLEQLRSFCSFAMSGQDWIDCEPFFDAIVESAQPAAAGVSDEPTDEQIEAGMRELFAGPKPWPSWEVTLKRVYQAMSALRPQAVPMTDERLAEVLTTAYGSPEWTMDDVRAARSVEAAALGITAQGAQGGEG